ncbi:MAG: hypothetical protein Kow0092_27480 [Deferrisomatales bacterium]
MLRDVLDALEGYPGRTDLVVRRREGTTRYWYTFFLEDLRDAARRSPERLERPLRELPLHEGMAARAYQVDESAPSALEEASGVLLDGDQVLGVLEPEPQRAARGGVPPVPRGEAPSGGPFPFGPIPAASPPPGPAAPAPHPSRTAPAPAPAPGPSARPFSAYPRLEAPEDVGPGQAFDLVVGLALDQQPGVAGGRFTLVTEEEAFDLVVQVLAPGFEAPQGIRRFLHVRRSHPGAAEVRVRLVAPTPEEALWVSHLEVEFTYEGHLLARAWREIRVVAAGTTAPGGPVETAATGFATRPDVAAPDLQVTINESPDETALEWLFTSPLPVDLPAGKVVTTLKGKNAQSFALGEIKTVAEKDGTRFIDEQILGIARHVSDAMPLEFWTVLGRVWETARARDPDTPASVLLVSSEPYIPWELASTEEDWVDPALLDPDRPPLLGAQLRVGRWIPPGPKRPRGVQRPSLPPAHRIEVDRIALVVGDYLAEQGQRPLPLAKEEGKKLSLRYDTVPLSATEDDLDRLLRDALERDGTPVSVSAVHFACHGEVDPANPRYNGIVLSDRSVRLSPNIVSGSRICRQREPFVFLNACQLGFSSELLADYGGMAGEFLRAGSRGFVAPLWSVDDRIARDVAVGFYERALDGEVPVGEVLREIRSRFDLAQDSPPSTYLAYVFYGHPNLILAPAAGGPSGG